MNVACPRDRIPQVSRPYGDVRNTMTRPSHLPISSLVLLATVLLAGSALAGTATDPEISDPMGDAIHFEFQTNEPSLDVTAVWFGFEAGMLVVHIEGPELDELGPEATQDPADEGSYYDVYWTMDGQDHVARVFVGADGEPVGQAGQSMRIERQAFWDEGDDIHGDLVEQHVELLPTGLLRIHVDPGVVGSPGPGSVLASPAFATYVDHHPPASGTPFGEHHPGHVDANDEPGRDFVLEGTADGDAAVDPETADEGEGDSIPAPGALLLLGLVIVAAVASRR